MAAKRALVKAGKKAKRAPTAIKGAAKVKPKVQAGKKVSRVGKVVSKVGKGLPGGMSAENLMQMGIPAEQAIQLAPIRRRRGRGIFMRKGRVFIGFNQREIKNALRRSYGGKRSRTKCD